MIFPYIKEAVTSLFSKPSTVNYPACGKAKVPEGYRGKIIFHPDRCVNCGLCMKVCSPGAISRTIEKREDGDFITFTFDMGSCTFCQTCADFCNKHSIEMSTEYSMIATDPSQLLVTGSYLKKPRPIPPRKPAPPKDGAAPAKPAAPAAPAAKDEAKEEVKAPAEAPKAETKVPVSEPEKCDTPLPDPKIDAESDLCACDGD